MTDDKKQPAPPPQPSRPDPGEPEERGLKFDGLTGRTIRLGQEKTVDRAT